MTSGLGAYVIAAGGTGGHIIPGIALANEIRAQKPGAEIVFVGTAQGLEQKIVPAAGYPLELVDASGFVGKTAGQAAPVPGPACRRDSSRRARS